MIIKETYKKVFTFFLLGLFLISTSGIVLFYHFCKHSHHTIYSFYIDDTQELCAENAILYDDFIPHDDHCCSEELDHHDHSDNNKCCQKHKSFQKTVKINLSYTYTKQLKSPKPLELKLFFEQYTEVFFTDNLYTLSLNLLFKSPPDSPKLQLTGRDIITHHQTLKLDC